MPRLKHRMRHPKNPQAYALIGFDHVLGFCIESRGVEKGPSTYDMISPDYDRHRPLWGALVFLCAHGYYTLSQLQDALTYGELGGRKPRSRGALVALEAVAALKAAADQ